MINVFLLGLAFTVISNGGLVAQMDSVPPYGIIINQGEVDENEKNLFFFEALGSGGVYSFNFEHLFLPSEVGEFSGAFSIRTGLSLINGFVVPITAHYYFKVGNFYYGLGAGLTIYWLNFGAEWEESGVYYGPIMGFRYMFPHKKLFLQANYTPMFDNIYEQGHYQGTQIYYWGGLGIGWRLE